jgi:ribosomal-protein-alanine N-acetyltransferase
MSFILETQRLRLKPIRGGDLNTLHSIFTNPYVRKYLNDDKIFSMLLVAEMIVENQRLFMDRQFGLWFIEAKDTSQIIGFVGLWYFFGEEQPQLVYALLPEATKNGYASEAATKILEYSFCTLGYDYLIASCNKSNLESRKLAERIGMEEVEEKVVHGSSIIFLKITNSLDLGMSA